MTQAINKKHQATVNRAIQWLTKHNDYNDQRDAIENEQDTSWSYTPQWNRINKKCEDSYDKYLTYFDELPSREQAQINKLGL